MRNALIIFATALVVLLGLPAAAQAKNYCVQVDDHYVMKDLSEGDPEIANSVPIEKCDPVSPSPSYILAVPERPDLVENTCTDDAHLILPDTTGVDYTYIYSYLVEATPKFGYIFDPSTADQTRFFKFKLKKAGEGLNCSPSPSQSVSISVSPSHHEVVRPMPNPSESSHSTALPSTGNSGKWLIIAGIAALFIGALLYVVLFFLRKRRTY